MPSWVIAGQLARSSRPGYDGERSTPVARHTVDAWLEQVKAMGIASIICFLAEDQLAYYDGLPAGLLGVYHEAGLSVAHVPAPDLRRPPLDEAQLEEAWQAYRMLPKPVLVHCSAGFDRTGHAVEHIRRRLGEAR